MKYAMPIPIMPLIRYFDDRYGLANGAEVAVLKDLIIPYFEQYRGCQVPNHLDFEGVIDIRKS